MGRRIIVWPTPRTIEREWNMFHVYFIGGVPLNKRISHRKAAASNSQRASQETP